MVFWVWLLLGESNNYISLWILRPLGVICCSSQLWRNCSSLPQPQTQAQILLHAHILKFAHTPRPPNTTGGEHGEIRTPTPAPEYHRWRTRRERAQTEWEPPTNDGVISQEGMLGPGDQLRPPSYPIPVLICPNLPVCPLLERKTHLAPNLKTLGIRWKVWWVDLLTV